MKTLLKISWRNVWRSPRRSLVMIIAIAMGLWGGIFAAALSFGMIRQRFEQSIGQHISHIQIHHPEFLKENSIDHSIQHWDPLQATLSRDPQVSAFSGRTVSNGMLASANLTRGVSILGINPQQEAATTGIDDNLVQGDYFGQQIRNPILIGKALAEKTKLQERSRLVLTFQDARGELVSAAFRVAGIFQTSNSMYDEQHVYVRQQDLNELLGTQQAVNEVAIKVQELELTVPVKTRYQEQFPGLSVRSWDEISPELSYMQEMSGMMLMIVLVIILLALAFGLVNTMLMSVFERIRELGILKAIGMNKRRIFIMIILETSFLTFLGALAGMLLGVFTIQFFGNRGLDLAAVGGDSLNEFGFSSVIYPTLETSFFLMLIALVVLTALLTALYPSMKALNLQPAQAIRKD